MREEDERCLRRGQGAHGVGAPGRACECADTGRRQKHCYGRTESCPRVEEAMRGENERCLRRGSEAPGIGPGRAGKSATGKAGSKADRQREAADVRVDEEPDRERRGRNARANKQRHVRSALVVQPLPDRAPGNHSHSPSQSPDRHHLRPGGLRLGGWPSGNCIELQTFSD